MKHKRKMRTTEEKAELVKGFLAATNKRDYGRSVGINDSMIRKWAQKIEPKLRAANTAVAKRLPQVRIDVPDFISDIREAGDVEVGFDDSEHHMIMFACGEARRILDSIMYKLKKMEVPQR